MKIANSTHSIRKSSRATAARTAADRFASALRQFILEFAKRLLPAGITPGYLNSLVNRAFVEAAAEISKCGNGRVNRSRVAVLTALRRAEVKRLLSDSKVSVPIDLHRPRTERVIAGWLTDRRYVDAHGRPRKLRANGQRTSFKTLVRTFAGDVPPRAVLKELNRLGVVREDGGYMELKSVGNQVHRRASYSIQEVIDLLLDGIVVSNENGQQEPGSQFHRVALNAESRLQMTMMKRRASSGTTNFLDGLKRSLVTPSSLKGKPPKHKLTVTVLIREHRNSHKRAK